MHHKCQQKHQCVTDSGLINQEPTKTDAVQRDVYIVTVEHGFVNVRHGMSWETKGDSKHQSSTPHDSLFPVPFSDQKAILIGDW